MNAPPIAFVDLKSQRARLGPALDDALHAAMDAGQFIDGPAVEEIEGKLASFCGARHAIATANGTDAITLCLMALGVGPSDAVLLPSFTFAATAEGVVLLGATPVFCDVDEETFTLDPVSLASAYETAKTRGLRPRAVISVDLFGQPADYETIARFSTDRGLVLICDAAQAFGASCDGRRVGTIGTFTTTSFFPAKPLGCYGDGGAVLTDDGGAAQIIRSLRSHGAGASKYEHVRVGLNSRLDTLQAVVLLHKLAIFPDEIAARERVAQRYTDALHDVAATPHLRAGGRSVWAQYTLRLPRGRDAFVAGMAAQGIPTRVYYPSPLHRQPAYGAFPIAGRGAAVAERLSGQVVSLPIHPYLDPTAQDRVIAAARTVLKVG